MSFGEDGLETRWIFLKMGLGEDATHQAVPKINFGKWRAGKFQTRCRRAVPNADNVLAMSEDVLEGDAKVGSPTGDALDGVGTRCQANDTIDRVEDQRQRAARCQKSMSTGGVKSRGPESGALDGVRS
ncbi:hypothetical protein QVD17_10003 [Tagetes erecta]|uniref:Uncharacterized protein n=1 Tax=Tagetes erecta TaxID=13708 RepID=A0AAD8P5T3_TARER|nr:hypothetical protein QVD17_10003 [Tagetes erecta]